MNNDLPSIGAEDDYKAWYEEAMVASNEAGFVGASAAETIRALVSERDALAGRVRELEVALRDARVNMADWASYAGSYFHQKYDLAGDLAAIDAALIASKEQP